MNLMFILGILPKVTRTLYAKITQSPQIWTLNTTCLNVFIIGPQPVLGSTVEHPKITCSWSYRDTDIEGLEKNLVFMKNGREYRKRSEDNMERKIESYLPRDAEFLKSPAASRGGEGPSSSDNTVFSTGLSEWRHEGVSVLLVPIFNWDEGCFLWCVKRHKEMASTPPGILHRRLKVGTKACTWYAFAMNSSLVWDGFH